MWGDHVVTDENLRVIWNENCAPGETNKAVVTTAPRVCVIVNMKFPSQCRFVFVRSLQTSCQKTPVARNQIYIYINHIYYTFKVDRSVYFLQKFMFIHNHSCTLCSFLLCSIFFNWLFNLVLLCRIKTFNWFCVHILWLWLRSIVVSSFSFPFRWVLVRYIFCVWVFK